jgi:pSer/pThr/pTyr-binding forkhead associated (FHA) protein
MDVTLRVTQGKNVGQDVPIPGKKFLIGRAEDCHLRAGSDLISRHHCIIIIEDGYLSLRDFGSKNGSYVNDERVGGECELKHGDQLRVGPLEFTVQVSQGSLSGKKKPPVHDAKEAAARTAASPVEEEPDVARWLSEPAQPVRDPATQDTQMVRTSDTDEIDVGSTREFGLMAAENSAAAHSLSTQPQPVAPRSAPGDSKAIAPAQSKATAEPKAVATMEPKAVATIEPQPAVKIEPQPVARIEPKQAAAVPKPVAAPSKPAVPEPVVHHPRQTAPLTAFVADPPPASEATVPEAAAPAVPAPVAEKKGFFGGGKKFGKLPQQAKEGTKDSRSAASDMLDKLRKRR